MGIQLILWKAEFKQLIVRTIVPIQNRKSIIALFYQLPQVYENKLEIIVKI